ncbi:unnamed protein product, partial [Iphiclides podalirius]
MKQTNLHQGNVKKGSKICLIQEDFEELAAHSKNEKVLRWIWLTWREKTGPPLKRFYTSLVNIENKAARRNGYTDIGESWREELEIPYLRRQCRRLYNSVRPLYTLLHGVVRYFLRNKYGDVVPERGPIPAHLLGNLWLQNWESLADAIIPNVINLDASMKNMNWNVQHMVKRAEDFYLSLSLPSMTDNFWGKSVFNAEGNDNVRCHGTAANMFKNDDYRMLYCSGVSFQDFNVVHHEMGHIQYYMAYENQPGLFRQANSALHESIGDAITIGVVTPQHLNRLGLINDSLLYSMDEGKTKNKITIQPVLNEEGTVNETKSTPASVESGIEKLIESVTTGEILLLKRALNKLPHIPFSLLIDEYRWKYFEGRIDIESLNKEFWDMSLQLQGISPPEVREEEFFDAGAIYHVADNTPYIRYFLSSFLQHQLFEHFCKVSIFGNKRAREPLPETMVLNRCDIYGAKAAGKLLK